MWNQVGSECMPFCFILAFPCIHFRLYMLAVLLIRTYAFFSRNNYLLATLLCALAGVVGYQLFVDTSEMMRMFLDIYFQFHSDNITSPAVRHSTLCKSLSQPETKILTPLM